MSGLLVTREGGIMRITLDRPEKLNAIDGELAHKARLAFEEAAIVREVRVVVLTGSGRAFCAGQDLADPAVAPGSDLGMMLEHFYNPLIRAMRALPKPIVARVNGVAAGAGANLAFAADIVVAARSASFIESFSRIGLLPDSGGTWMLPRLFGHARAIGLAMLGERISAEQAHAWGAIWQVVDDADLDTACDTLAATLAQAPTRALGAIKTAFEANASATLDAALNRERELQRLLGATRDYREGVEAFSAKRKAEFEGR
jgi:2-(1,2-epoxy-1,2-dihydrophenyl)acetyl-CoA isomerase